MPRWAWLLLAALLLAALLWAISGQRASPQSAAKGRPPPCEARRFDGSLFTACRYDSRTDEIALFLDEAGTPLRSLARLETHLGSRAGRLLFAMNAGMYDDRGLPIGLYVEDGRRRHAINLRNGPGNFHMKPNGILAVDSAGRVSIPTSEDWAASGRKALWATQSGPMLLIHGKLHPGIQPNGESLHIRNGVCTADGRTAWFVISDEPVSFGRFARFLRDGLGCRDALFFDGAVSSLWAPASGRQDGAHLVGPMVAVFRHP